MSYPEVFNEEPAEHYVKAIEYRDKLREEAKRKNSESK